MATTTRKRRSTDTRNDPHPLASGDQSIRLLRKSPDGVGNDFRINQDPPTPNSHPRTGATTRVDEPSWHQLLRHTVEFSKNRRASLSHSCERLTGGNRSNLSDPPRPVKSVWTVPIVWIVLRRGDARAHTSRCCRSEGVVVRGTSHRVDPRCPFLPAGRRRRTLRTTPRHRQLGAP
jgi:hypothetical protein